MTKDSAQENNEATCKDEVLSPTVFVNTRRGKRNGTKRRISDTATVTEHDAAEVLCTQARPPQIHDINRTSKWHIITATARCSYITGTGISYGILYQYLFFVLTRSGVMT